MAVNELSGDSIAANQRYRHWKGAIGSGGRVARVIGQWDISESELPLNENSSAIYLNTQMPMSLPTEGF